MLPEDPLLLLRQLLLLLLRQLLLLLLRHLPLPPGDTQPGLPHLLPEDPRPGSPFLLLGTLPLSAGGQQRRLHAHATTRTVSLKKRDSVKSNAKQQSRMTSPPCYGGMKRDFLASLTPPLTSGPTSVLKVRTIRKNVINIFVLLVLLSAALQPRSPEPVRRRCHSKKRSPRPPDPNMAEILTMFSKILPLMFNYINL